MGPGSCFPIFTFPFNFTDSLCFKLGGTFVDEATPLCSILSSLFPGLSRNIEIVKRGFKGVLFVLLESRGLTICRTSVLPAKTDSDVMFCLQSYQGLMIDIPLVYSDLSIRVSASGVYKLTFDLIVNKNLCHCHSWLARQ